MTAGLMGSIPAKAQTRAFNVPAGDINRAIPLFAQQSGIQIIVSADHLDGVQSPEIRGVVDARVALKRLIARAGLEIAKDNGAIILLRRRRGGGERPSQPIGLPDHGRQEIIVTGSRIAREGRSPSGTATRVGRSRIEFNAAPTLESSLNQLPQFAPGQTAFATHFAATGISTLNMRGLGAQRNLVLLDGRRLQPSTAAFEIDVNTIPSMLVDSIDLVTGGASAVYGSDAISGVINFRLRPSLNGLRLRGQSSITQRGDGRDTQVEITAGESFADGRGHAVLALSYNDRQAVPRRARAFFRRSYAVGGGSASGTLPQGALMPDATNLPSQAALENLFARYGVVDTIAPSSTLGFNPDGTLFTQNGKVRNYRGPGAEAGYGINNTGSLVYDPNIEDGLMAPMERFSLFSRITFDASDRLAWYAQGYATRYRNQSLASASLATGYTRLVVPVSNPFVSDDLATILASRPDPMADFSLTKRFTANGGRTVDHRFDIFQLLAGMKGRLPGRDIGWDIYVSHGETRTVDRLVNSNMISGLLQQLLQSPDGGTSLCEGGFDPFRDMPLSPQCIAYVSREVVSRTRSRQTVVEASAQGNLLSLPAGPVGFALGASYRRNSYAYRPDPVLYPNPTGLLAFLSSAPTHGATGVKEVYGELLVPLLRDRPMATALSVNLAARYSDYDDAGGVAAYKADANWTILPNLTVRGGYQRAVRAPNVGEIFSGAVSTINALGSPAAGGGDPCDVRTVYRQGSDAAAIRTICLAQGVPSAAIDFYRMDFNQFVSSRSGNPALRPEQADTMSIGAEFSPRATSPWLRNLTLSADYYRISLARAIGFVAAPQILTNCFTRANNPDLDPLAPDCQAIARNDDGTIQAVATPYRNLGAYRTNGVDMRLNWSLPLEAFGASSRTGTLSLDLLVSRLGSFRIQAASDQPFLQYAGTIGGTAQVQPRWRAMTSLTYKSSRSTLGLRWRHLSAMDDVTRETTPATERPGVPAYDNFDLFGSLRIGQELEVRAGIDNLADREPPVVAGLAGYTDLGTYDGLGRRCYVGFTAKF